MTLPLIILLIDKITSSYQIPLSENSDLYQLLKKNTNTITQNKIYGGQIALSIVIYAVWNFTRRIYHGRKNT